MLSSGVRGCKETSGQTSVAVALYGTVVDVARDGVTKAMLGLEKERLQRAVQRVSVFMVFFFCVDEEKWSEIILMTWLKKLWTTWLRPAAARIKEEKLMNSKAIDLSSVAYHPLVWYGIPHHTIPPYLYVVEYVAKQVSNLF